MADIKAKLVSSQNYNETRIYIGSVISSSIFNGQMTKENFEILESKIKKSCRLDSIPYGLYNEYCYDKYTYHTNVKMDKLTSYEVVETQNSVTPNFDCKIDHIKLKEHNTVDFDSKKNYDHVQPFLEGVLKLNNYIYIKLRKNLFTYDINGPVSSYQIYIILKNTFNTVRDKNDSLTLADAIINDLIN